MQQKERILTLLTIGYFIVAFLEVLAEYIFAKPFICLLKPLLTVFLLGLYILKSKKANPVFILVLLTSLLTNLLFIPNTSICLFYALIVFTAHRLLVINLIFKLQNIKDYVPVFIATAPFILIFFYLFMETTDIPEESYLLLIIQNILISVFAGLSLSAYVMNDNKQNSILLISALLFVMLQFAVFIEKYFLTNEFEQLLRPLAMTLNALAFFSFYKYVITAEVSNHNNGLSV